MRKNIRFWLTCIIFILLMLEPQIGKVSSLDSPQVTFEHVTTIDNGEPIELVVWHPILPILTASDSTVSITGHPTIKLWAPFTGQQQASLSMEEIEIENRGSVVGWDSINTLSWNPQGSELLVVMNYYAGALLDLDLQTDTVFTLNTGINYGSWSPDGSQIIFSTGDDRKSPPGDTNITSTKRQLLIWDLGNQNYISSLLAEWTSILRAYWNPVEDLVALVDWDQVVTIFDLSEEEIIAQLPLREEVQNVWPLTYDWNASGTMLAGIDCLGQRHDCLIWTWEIRSNKFMYFKASTGYPLLLSTRNLVWNPRLDIIASSAGSEAAGVFVWDATSGERIAELDGFDDFVTTVTWDSSGTYLAAGSRDGTIKVWEMITE